MACYICGLENHNDQLAHKVGSTCEFYEYGTGTVQYHCDDGRAVFMFENGEVHTFHHLTTFIAGRGPLTLAIQLGDGEPDIEINNSFDRWASLAEFAESPELARLTRKQRRKWVADLEGLITEIVMLDLKNKGEGE
jgi:hypothetical protein